MSVDITVPAVLTIIAVALIFDFINGFHDSANSIATVVSTRVLTPGAACVDGRDDGALVGFVDADQAPAVEQPPADTSQKPHIDNQTSNRRKWLMIKTSDRRQS